jgi:2-furoate---CoA ligase
LTYAQWDVETERNANVFGAVGVGRGDRAVLLMKGGTRLATLHMAAQKGGVTSVPLSTRFGVDEVAYCVEDCTPSLVVTDETTHESVMTALDRLAERPRVAWSGAAADAPAGTLVWDDLVAEAVPTRVLPEPSADDISVLLYTSGTTGRPKGVPRTHRAEHSATVAHVIQSGHAPAETTLGVMPLFHTMGIRSLLASIVVAGTWVPQSKFDADESLELIQRERVTALYLVPTIYWSLLQTGRLGEATSVRRLAYAGASMTPTLADGLLGTLAPERFVNHVGSTEIYTFTISPDVAAKPGSAGRAGVFSRVRLVAGDAEASSDALVSPGETGQLIVSMESPEAFSGYRHRPDADTKAIREGWYFTGDLAVADDEGDFWVAGRVDDMINSGGENIYPDEIENALARCPDVSEVIVAGTPDDKWGHTVSAFVVPQEGVDPHQTLSRVQLFAREHSGLPSMKRPKRFIAISAIPKSAVGKILRRRLSAGEYQALAELGEAASPHVSDRQP